MTFDRCDFDRCYILFMVLDKTLLKLYTMEVNDCNLNCAVISVDINLHWLDNTNTLSNDVITQLNVTIQLGILFVVSDN